MPITTNTRVAFLAKHINGPAAVGTVTEVFEDGAKAFVTWDHGTACEVEITSLVPYLAHGNFVRHDNWIGDAICTVGTARSFALINGRDPEEAHAAAIKRHQETAWTIYVGGTLMADGPAKDAHYARKAAERLRAVTLAEGETVCIEGEFFTTRYVSGNTGQFPRNCDPIQFNPIQKAEAA